MCKTVAIIGHAGDCLYSTGNPPPTLPNQDRVGRLVAITTAEIERNEKSVSATPRPYAAGLLAARVVGGRGLRRR